MNIKLLVAAHKPYWMPSDPMYLPLHVGRKGKPDLGLHWQGDDSGENISEKNVHYCELTGLYWAWKNLEADAIGIVHYRRHFAGVEFSSLVKPTWFGRLLGFLSGLRGSYSLEAKRACVISSSRVERLLSLAPVIVPPQRDYFIETVEDHYAHAHHREDITCLRRVLADRSPASLPAFDAVMRGSRTHLFNMFIMHRIEFDAYCTWLFDILFELEKRLDISAYSKNDARVFGFVSERLLDVWLNTKGISYQECPLIFMEKSNWLKKGGSFLIRKVKNVCLINLFY